MKTPLVSKNRAANELREQAHKLRSELMDPAASFTAEEVEKRTADIRALEMRAQTAAEFTADAEVARQGGDEGLVRVDVDGGERKDFGGMKDANAGSERSCQGVPVRRGVHPCRDPWPGEREGSRRASLG